MGFETGGIPEMIDHLKNGYVAKYKDTNDLAVGIKWIIDKRLFDLVRLASARCMIVIGNRLLPKNI